MIKRFFILIGIVFCISSCSLFGTKLSFTGLKYLPSKIVCDIPSIQGTKALSVNSKTIQSGTLLKGYSPLNDFYNGFLGSYNTLYNIAVHAIVADMSLDELDINVTKTVSVEFTEQIRTAALSLLQAEYAKDTRLFTIGTVNDFTLTRKPANEKYEYIIEFIKQDSSFNVYPMTLYFKHDKSVIEADCRNAPSDTTKLHFNLLYENNSGLTSFYNNFEDTSNENIPRRINQYTLKPVDAGILMSSLYIPFTNIQGISPVSAFIFADWQYCSGIYSSSNTLISIGEDGWAFRLGPSFTECVEPMDLTTKDRWLQIYKIGDQSYNGTDADVPSMATSLIEKNNLERTWEFFSNIKSLDQYSDDDPFSKNRFLRKYLQLQGLKKNEGYVVYSDSSTILDSYISNVLYESPSFVGYIFCITDDIAELQVYNVANYDSATKIYLHKILKPASPGACDVFEPEFSYSINKE